MMDTWMMSFNYPYSPFIFRDHGLKFSSISLDPSHILTPELLKLAGVALSRLNTPVITWWRHHHLLSETEIENAFKGIGGHKLREPPNEPDWWPLFEEQRAVAYSGSPVQLERDIVFINSGPHWIRGEFSGDSTEDNILVAYDRMVQWVNTRFSKLTRGIDVYWFSTTPGHMECEQYQHPETNRTHPFSTKDPAARNYNWDQFQLMNNIVQKRVNYSAFERTAVGAVLGKSEKSAISSDHAKATRFQYVDAWNMTIQRPDAHKGPLTDCLHYCMLGVVSGWRELQWQTIMFDSAHTDYGTLVVEMDNFEIVPVDEEN
ncbi:hypothetical protein HDU84_007688 [Entophlyctis sp. JEL0112]|nr:hypothetical protein HDU84_007688 [Entophlyctis sp. JEL0112]